MTVTRIRIRTARTTDLPALRHDFARTAVAGDGCGLEAAILDGCAWLACDGDQVVAAAVFDLKTASLSGLRVIARKRRQGMGRALLAAMERRAVAFGITQVTAEAEASSLAFWAACGYQSQAGLKHRVFRSLARRQTRLGAHVAGLAKQLGIPRDYGQQHRLPLQAEATQLQGIGPDAIGREHFLLPTAARAWLSMVDSARDQSVDLQVASSFRSVDYQAGIIRRKLEAGQDMTGILRVSAAPGYSEHHSGRAVDVTTSGSRPLEDEFELTQAFAWLSRNADRHGFRLSYPRDNRHQIAFEPWHWYYTGR